MTLEERAMEMVRMLRDSYVIDPDDLAGLIEAQLSALRYAQAEAYAKAASLAPGFAEFAIDAFEARGRNRSAIDETTEYIATAIRNLAASPGDVEAILSAIRSAQAEAYAKAAAVAAEHDTFIANSIRNLATDGEKT